MPQTNPAEPRKLKSTPSFIVFVSCCRRCSDGCALFLPSFAEDVDTAFEVGAFFNRDAGRGHVPIDRPENHHLPGLYLSLHFAVGPNRRQWSCRLTVPSNCPSINRSSFADNSPFKTMERPIVAWTWPCELIPVSLRLLSGIGVSTLDIP